MPQTHHAVLPTATHDEAAREGFSSALRKLFTTELFPGVREIYNASLLPKFEAEHGRKPQTVKEVSALLDQTPYYREACLLGRTAQELVWDTVGESIERQLPALIDNARPKPGDCGSVAVDAKLPIPRYIQAVDIHVMPGNFHTELAADDIYAGALYDRGVHVFAFGGLGEQNDAYGEAIVAYIKQHFPHLQPRRILDIGCGIGSATLPLARAWPHAEVHGIDIGAPMVRYAHGRAESLGVKAHFSQQDMAALNFPDGHFDLVVSIIVTHEAPVPVLRKMLAEAHRVLAPGGVMMHDGSFNGPPPDPFDALMQSWFGHNANEPFSFGFKRLDFAQAFEDAGFVRERFFSGTRPAVYLQGQLPPVSFIGAVK